MKVIGIDPSLTATGVAIIDDGEPLLACEVLRIRSVGKRLDSLTMRRSRLTFITRTLGEMAERHQPDLVVIEAPAYGAPGGSTHDRSGLWWLIVYALGARHRLVEISPPARVKYGTGKGNAPKDQVLAAVVRRYPLVMVDDNNQADAFLLAAMGMRHLGHPIDDLPATHLAAMDKVRWLD